MSESASPIRLTADRSGILVDVLVVPRASRCAVAGVYDGRLKVTIDAPPVDGRANEALIAFLAYALKRPKRDIKIVRGEKGRKKTLTLSGLTLADVMALVHGG